MDCVRGIINVKPRHQGAAVTIGNFDGVHLGHQAVLQQLRHIATAEGCAAGIISFEPHPLAFFRPRQAPKRLTALHAKMPSLAALKMDWLLLLAFKRALASLPAEQFVEEILLRCLKVKHLLVGHDFHFGAQRRGDVRLLRDMACEYGFQVHEAEVFLWQQQRLSSSMLREWLKAGKIESLNKALNRAFSVRGRVQHGRAQGRQWGYPTANIQLPIERTDLPFGIYVVTAISQQYGRLPAVASYGVRPTVADQLQPLLEVHCLQGQHYDFYGQPLQVEFHRFLRSESKFASIELLKKAIAKDCQQAREYFQDDRL